MNKMAVCTVSMFEPSPMLELVNYNFEMAVLRLQSKMDNIPEIATELKRNSNILCCVYFLTKLTQ